MQLVALGADLPDEWDAVCAASSEGWMWQDRNFLTYSRDYSGDRLVAEVNLAVEDEGRLVAIAPCSILRLGDGTQLGVGDGPAAWPAFSPELEPSRRRKAEQLVFGGYVEVAGRHGASAVVLQSSALCRLFTAAQQPPACLPVRHGYASRVRDTFVIDLRQPLEVLKAAVRKGHRTAIRQGREAMEISVWNGSIEDAEFAAYQELHALANGRVTRPQSTFDAQRAWLRNGEGVLVGGRRGGQWVGFVWLLRKGNGAYYGSACNRPDTARELAVGHALFWEALESAKGSGVEFLEMGPQDYPVPGGTTSDDKLASLGTFKRGFGGTAWPLYLSERLVDDVGTAG